MLAAPFVGAWIEMELNIDPATLLLAAPFVGAWIEISALNLICMPDKGPHPSWVRGLKYTWFEDDQIAIISRTLRGCVD